ncbi:hypothetical protein [Daejeonella sp.]|jgi:hypothetical protein|uniref:hypothetical protein n=1 Tax=Daejeonella sp. TaxID=2805397 RepID=UPI0025C0D350|nr:hypothetical protein [Daejeonella sp.]
MNNSIKKTLTLLVACLIALHLFIEFTETSLLHGKEKWISVSYLSLILIIDAIEYFQRRKEKRLSNNDL